jgi:Mrp family chromosome partitioning ATPase
MSKNFELLQNLAKERDLFDTGSGTGTSTGTNTGTAVISEARPVEVNPIGASPLQLAADEGQRDELGKLVQRVFLQREPEAFRSVLFCGTEPGNGCSWTCARAAEILASQVTASVCVVDANLRAPSLHREFGVENHHGLSDSLLAGDPIRSFISPVRHNLAILSCGANPSSARALLSSDRMRSRLAELNQEFDFVLIDASSVSMGNETVALGRAADGVVLILKASSSRRDSVRQTIQQFENASVRVLGAVLNQRTFPVPAGLYHRL